MIENEQEIKKQINFRFSKIEMKTFSDWWKLVGSDDKNFQSELRKVALWEMNEKIRNISVTSIYDELVSVLRRAWYGSQSQQNQYIKNYQNQIDKKLEIIQKTINMPTNFLFKVHGLENILNNSSRQDYYETPNSIKIITEELSEKIMEKQEERKDLNAKYKDELLVKINPQVSRNKVEYDFDNIVKSFKYTLNEEEAKTYQKWWNLVKNRIPFEAQFRRMLLKAIEKQSTRDRVNSIYEKLIYVIQNSWWATSAKQFHEVQNSFDFILNRLNTIELTLNLLVNFIFKIQYNKEEFLKNIDGLYLETPPALRIIKDKLDRKTNSKVYKRGEDLKRIEKNMENRINTAFKSEHNFDMNYEYIKNKNTKKDDEYNDLGEEHEKK